jgi:serine/threonine protein kinase
MKSLSGFPFVLDLHYCFQSANYLYMIIDYCPNGDFTNLKCINNLKLFFAEVILAFEHIHKHNTVYRDLKPENIILDEEGHIKVCDFNLAKSGVTKEKKALSFCGSPMYLSPDMLSGKGVDGRCDIYGIGLIMYELITGYPAFNADDINTLYQDIKKNKINYNLPGLDEESKDLLKKILVADPEERISLEEMKKHPYFKDISFLKVYKKEYGPILIKKKDKNNEEKKMPILVGDKYFEVLDEKKKKEKEKLKAMKEKEAFMKFRQDQLKLDEDKNFTFLDGKISVKEMKKDLKRDMKNYVREFYFVKKEDIKQTEDFHLTVNTPINTKELLLQQNYNK